MRQKLKDIFNSNSIKKALLVTVSSFALLGVSSAAIAGHDLPNQYIFIENAQDICSQTKMPESFIGYEKRVQLDDAVFTLQNSTLAGEYLRHQEDKLCLSPYDISVNIDKYGVIQEQSSSEKGQLLLLAADELVNNDLINREFPETENKRSIYGEFRTAVRMALTAQILVELAQGGDAGGLNAAINTRYGTVFQNFQDHNDYDINNGKAHTDAITAYFQTPNNHHHAHRHTYTESAYSFDSLYEMGQRPDMPNIFAETFFSRDNFNFGYFINSKTTRTPYNRTP